MAARIEQRGNNLALFSDFDRNLVDAIKAQIPATGRCPVYNGSKFSHWEVSPQYGQLLAGLCQQHLGEYPQVPLAQSTRPQVEQRLIRVEYIGQLKDRGDGNLTAFGAKWTNTAGTLNYDAVMTAFQKLRGQISPNQSYSKELDWAYIFSESVLRQWFEGDNQKQDIVTTTYYSILALKRNAQIDQIKSAWRQMVKRYHPDINHDDDAAEMTRLINEAYEVLRNPTMRKRYDAGLALEASLNQPKQQSFTSRYWRPPIRCGLILATGHNEVGRFVVDQIHEWHDITENGMTLVTSWDTTSNSLIREWV